jgi:hypothetical protein
MPREQSSSLKNRTDPHVAKQLNRNLLVTRGPIQRPNCWKLNDNTSMIDTIIRGWECPPIYILPRESDDGEDEDHIFDGAHKVEAVINFIQNTYALGKVEDTSPLKPHVGKKFNELPKEVRNKILNYEFTLNYIDNNTAHNADAYQTLWLRLNKSGKKVNDFEATKPIIHNLVDNVLNPSSKEFFGTEIYQKTDSDRGALENILQTIIAISESNMNDYTTKFSSRKQLIKLWQDARLGNNSIEITKIIDDNTEKWLDILKRARGFLKTLADNNAFVDDEGKPILESAHRGTEIVFLIARLTTHYPASQKPHFNRIAPALAKKMKEKYFLTVERDTVGRNGSTQRRILSEINQIIMEFASEKEPRAFTKEQIEEVRIKQNGICAFCKEIMLSGTYAGDHIFPWSRGGTTETSNCQVIHKSCNSAKGNKIIAAQPAN